MAESPNMTREQAGQEMAKRSVDFTAGKKSVGQLTTMLGATKQAVGQLEFNVKKTKEEMIKYTMRKSFKYITDQMKK
jgi:hypothetical protein